jgi:CelD/BcsL family acetyltransferase involved in cellulose biosynthesis
MAFSILTPDSPAWGDLFGRLPADQRDVFYTPSFARLCQTTINREDEVLCAALESGDVVVLYPFAKRDLGRLTPFPEFSGRYDITGLYGRGGIVTSQATPEILAQFHAAMADYCHANAIMCGFDRYHPVMANEAHAGPASRVMDIGGFVVVDLRPELEAIHESFKSSVRKDLRKAERHGVHCFDEANDAHLQNFLNIYHATMARNAASEFYYFSAEYFETLCRTIPGQFHFFYAVVDDRIVSCELVLLHGKYAHSFLGGTWREALPLAANPMLKWEIIRTLKARGCEYFLLGGGTQPDDGIFQFKKAYAPEGVLPSRIGGTIWDHDAYRQLREAMVVAGIAVPEKRFQFYDLN